MQMQNGRPMYHDQGRDTSWRSGVFNSGSHCYNNVRMVIIISIPNMPQIYRIPKKVTEINTRKRLFSNSELGWPIRVQCTSEVSLFNRSRLLRLPGPYRTTRIVALNDMRSIMLFRKPETYWISVKRSCHGGNPWSSKTFPLDDGNTSCTIVKSGSGKPSSPNICQWSIRDDIIRADIYLRVLR